MLKIYMMILKLHSGFKKILDIFYTEILTKKLFWGFFFHEWNE